MAALYQVTGGAQGPKIRSLQTVRVDGVAALKVTDFAGEPDATDASPGQVPPLVSPSVLGGPQGQPTPAPTRRTGHRTASGISPGPWTLGLRPAFPPGTQPAFHRPPAHPQISFEGRQFQLAETLCVPPPASSPHPEIMIGGGGEKKTPRLVARYGEACDLFATSGEEVAHTIRRTVTYRARPPSKRT
ncbi:hypothetical protein [Streptomyces canus]|uniref:hypothetical protein n=1 Tax=Streptomyces canus TaxID=58343 RepID=UPI003255D6B7